MDLLRLPEAARQLGVSFPTMKQWIYHRKIKTIRTAGGHHRVPQTEVEGREPRGRRRPRRRAASRARRHGPRAIHQRAQSTGGPHRGT
jgi:excisionase family DNA binding protein